ncbi:hypothetical protein JD969_19515 [Planctomycetota bacterium]|nr:hypothetical protein JD969_19515 [Planctomycetota bacterium]
MHINSRNDAPQREEQTSQSYNLTINSNTFTIAPPDANAVKLIQDPTTKHILETASIQTEINLYETETLSTIKRNNEIWLALSKPKSNKSNIITSASFDPSTPPNFHENSKLALLQYFIMFNEDGKLAPFCFDLSIRINNKIYPINGKIIYEYSFSIVGTPFQIEKAFPAETANAVTCDIILTPNPRYAQDNTDLTEIFADTITYKNVPIVWISQATEEQLKSN